MNRSNYNTVKSLSFFNEKGVKGIIGLLFLSLCIVLPFLLNNSRMDSMKWIFSYYSGKSIGFNVSEILLDLSPYLFFSAFISFYVIQATLWNRLKSFFFLTVLFVFSLLGAISSAGFLSPLVCGVLPYFLNVFDENVEFINSIFPFFIGAFAAALGVALAFYFCIGGIIVPNGFVHLILIGAAPWEVGIGLYLLWNKFKSEKN